jgi:hypothetical protein
MSTIDTSPARWIEQHVDGWILARIKGEEWVPEPVPPQPVLIKRKEVERRTGFSHVHIWRLEKIGKFPRRVRNFG